MKKIIGLILCTLVLVPTAFAGAATDKLERGVVGFFTAPVEIPLQYEMAIEKYSFPADIFAGTARAIGMTGKRVVNGVWDVLTFPFDFPKDGGLLLKDSAATGWENRKMHSDSHSAAK